MDVSVSTLPAAAAAATTAARPSPSSLLSLSSLSLTALRSEPSRLSDASRRLRYSLAASLVSSSSRAHADSSYSSSVEEVAVSHYRVFVKAQQSLESLSTLAAQAMSRVHFLPSCVDSLERTSEHCTGVWERLQQQSRIVSIVSEQQHIIDELIELPQLIDQCLQEQQFASALDVLERVRSVQSQRLLPDQLNERLKAAKERCVEALIADLRKSGQNLGSTLQAVALLRRSEALTDQQLRSAFLSARDEELNRRLKQVSDSSRTTLQILMEILDISRTAIFDISTHYKALFIEENDQILRRWLAYRLQIIISLLNTYVPKLGSGSYLASVLEQSMYCAVSLGSSGADFRSLLVPLFHTRVLALLSGSLSQSSERFRRSLQTMPWHLDSAMLYKLGITMDADDSTPLSSSSSVAVSTGDVVSYPCKLLSCGPLVMLAQGISAALHNIRECTPVALDMQIRKQVLSLLQNEAVYVCEELEHASADLTALGHMFVELLLPLVQQMLSAVSNRAPPSIEHIVDIFVRNDIYEHPDVPALVQTSLLDDAASQESSEDKHISEDELDVAAASEEEEKQEPTSTSSVSDTKSIPPQSPASSLSRASVNSA